MFKTICQSKTKLKPGLLKKKKKLKPVHGHINQIRDGKRFLSSPRSHKDIIRVSPAPTQ